jgi:hypothetical protein
LRGGRWVFSSALASSYLFSLVSLRIGIGPVLSSVWAFDWGRSLDLSGPFCSINKEAHIIIQPEANAWEGWKQTKSQSLSFFSSKKKRRTASNSLGGAKKFIQLQKVTCMQSQWSA